ncbi:MAG TPA: hypothetical protein VJ804_14690, partial [Acidimicrobiales bacterium]|nr:hypothetical protein [Acidimicrobiales bacterium]
GGIALLAAAGGTAVEVAADGALGVGPAAESGERNMTAAAGCAELPDIGTGVTGPHLTGASSVEEVRGFLDSHLHITAFEFLGGRAHCGRPWHPYGVTYALVDCPDHGIAGGSAAVMENFFGGDPLAQHDPVGWPSFRDWPAPRSLTHEQTYHRWLERAWRGGLRMIVNLFTDNRVLCDVYPLHQNSCDEMASAHLQAARIRELERYVDAQHGGPGEGWLRIVTDPYQARAVMNAGKVAVVLGIELSEPFGCRSFLGQAGCTTADIDRQLDELHALGVRQLFAIHKFDNALGGVMGDPGTQGVLVNLGNLDSAGHFIDMETCDEEGTGVHDNRQVFPADLGPEIGGLGGALGGLTPPGVVVPVYPPPEHCNSAGITELGRYAIGAMADRGLIVDVDHMGVRARQGALDLLEARRYSGVVSSHGWISPDGERRVLGLGGVVSPYAGGSTGFADAWARTRQWAPEGYVYGLGYGADSNGLGTQGDPRHGPNPVTYPFEGLGGTTIDRQVSGSRTFDVNVDGVAHYGLYPDWIEDLRHIAGDEIVEDLARGPEAYLQMWERADGIVRAAACPAPPSLAQVRPGMTAEEVLRTAGQPTRRAGDAFTYCDEQVRFDPTGLVLATTAPGAAGEIPATGGSTPLPLALLLLAASSALRWWRVRFVRPG